jgi:hypothetical protein
VQRETGSERPASRSSNPSPTCEKARLSEEKPGPSGGLQHTDRGSPRERNLALDVSAADARTRAWPPANRRQIRYHEPTPGSQRFETVGIGEFSRPVSKRRGPVGLQADVADAAPESALGPTSREVARIAGALALGRPVGNPEANPAIPAALAPRLSREGRESGLSVYRRVGFGVDGAVLFGRPSRQHKGAHPIGLPSHGPWGVSPPYQIATSAARSGPAA